MAADFMELVNRRAAEIAEAEAAMMAEHRAKLRSLNRTREQAVETFEALLATAAGQLVQAGVTTIRTGGRLLSKRAWMVGKPMFRRGNLYRGEYAVPVLLGAGGNYVFNALVTKGEGGYLHSGTRLDKAGPEQRRKLRDAKDDFPVRVGRSDLLLGSGVPVLQSPGDAWIDGEDTRQEFQDWLVDAVAVLVAGAGA